MIILAPRERDLKLMSNEIELIIEELERSEHNIFTFLNYQVIIDKLKKANNVDSN